MDLNYDPIKEIALLLAVTPILFALERKKKWWIYKWYVFAFLPLAIALVIAVIGNIYVILGIITLPV